MIYKNGDLFTTDCDAIGHGVNTKGLMGAGIADAFRRKYPDNYTSYYAQCSVNGLKPGGVHIYPAFDNGAGYMYDEPRRLIVNMASQDKPGANASYHWLFQSALKAAGQLISLGIDKCAIPQIGCGIGGLTWSEVEKVLISVETVVPGFEWEVWIYEN